VVSSVLGTIHITRSVQWHQLLLLHILYSSTSLSFTFQSFNLSSLFIPTFLINTPAIHYRSDQIPSRIQQIYMNSLFSQENIFQIRFLLFTDTLCAKTFGAKWCWVTGSLSSSFLQLLLYHCVWCDTSNFVIVYPMTTSHLRLRSSGPNGQNDRTTEQRPRRQFRQRNFPYYN